MKFRKKQLRNRSITLKAFAKINLSLDVIALRKDGYHELDMIMQQIDMYDLVNIRWYPNKGEKDFRIRIGSNLYYLPTDERNLAYKAAGSGGVCRFPINPALLAGIRAECHDSAGLTLAEIMALMIPACRAGKQVVRLHTENPTIYGAVREQMDGFICWNG